MLGRDASDKFIHSLMYSVAKFVEIYTIMRLP
jgi:hypothetical protein